MLPLPQRAKIGNFSCVCPSVMTSLHGLTRNITGSIFYAFSFLCGFVFFFPAGFYFAGFKGSTTFSNFDSLTFCMVSQVSQFPCFPLGNWRFLKVLTVFRDVVDAFCQSSHTHFLHSHKCTHLHTLSGHTHVFAVSRVERLARLHAHTKTHTHNILKHFQSSKAEIVASL